MTNQDKPAFPIRQEEGGYNQNGLTKREYFAAMAMQGLLAHTATGPKELLVQLSITHADELLKQLES